jgi:hypothetical protein
MSRIIPTITISREQHFTTDGTPDTELFIIDAVIDTPDEYDQIGRIEFQDTESLVQLHNILGSYIRMIHLDQPDDTDREQEGGDA